VYCIIVQTFFLSFFDFLFGLYSRRHSNNSSRVRDMESTHLQHSADFNLALQRVVLKFVVLQCIALHCLVLHYVALIDM